MSVYKEGDCEPEQLFIDVAAILKMNCCSLFILQQHSWQVCFSCSVTGILCCNDVVTILLFQASDIKIVGSFDKMYHLNGKMVCYVICMPGTAPNLE